MTLLGSTLTGVVLWELINPISMLHRGLIFGLGAAWTVVLSVFLFDLFVMSRGWCGRLCPVGAFYNLLGRRRLQRLHGLFRSLPRASGHSPGFEGRSERGRTDDPVGRLHQLRPLYRCLLERGFYLQPALQQSAFHG